jgi:hypothetical protein
MKKQISALLLLVSLGSIIASAQIIYDNGPHNGELDAYAFSGSYHGSTLVVSDTFTVSGGESTVNGISIWTWIFPIGSNPTAELSITSQPNGGTTYFDQVVQFNESNCYADGYGFTMCQETANWNNGPSLPNGTYWVNLQNGGGVPAGVVILWDQNNGAFCTSPGCPSQAQDTGTSIPSETFTIYGTSSGKQSKPPATTGR